MLSSHNNSLLKTKYGAKEKWARFKIHQAELPKHLYIINIAMNLGYSKDIHIYSNCLKHEMHTLSGHYIRYSYVIPTCRVQN